MSTVIPPRRVIVGQGVLVLREGRVLIGQRQGSHGAGKFAFPGGHQDFGEPWEVCGPREVEEETGMIVKFRYFDPDRLQKFLCVTDDFMPEDDKHYNTVYVVCDWVSGEPKLKEPDKCKEWFWATYTDLKQYSKGNNTFGAKVTWIPLEHIAIHLDRIGLMK